MTNDPVQCPVCGGLAKISRAELIRVLTDKELLQKLELYVAELSRASAEPVAAGAARSEFDKQVHSWNPENPMWRRSNKE
jgi:hypothetical protein